MGDFFYQNMRISYLLGSVCAVCIIYCKKGGFMDTHFDRLAHNLNLSHYQSNRLKAHYDRYNFSRLQKRGGVLYAPYAVHGFWQYVRRILLGVRADLIGQNRVLLRNQRNIKFCKNGYHSVRVGRQTYYANALGQVVSQQEFLDNKLC